MSAPIRLFVYGTLRRGSRHPMARRLAAAARYLGQGWIEGRLHDLGPYPVAVALEARSPTPTFPQSPSPPLPQSPSPTLPRARGRGNRTTDPAVRGSGDEANPAVRGSGDGTDPGIGENGDEAQPGILGSGEGTTDPAVRGSGEGTTDPQSPCPLVGEGRGGGRRAPRARVVGDVYELKGDAARLLAALDAYEGCGADDPSPRAYVRRPVAARLVRGGTVVAWCYLADGSRRRGRIVAGGDYARHRRRKSAKFRR